jgi:hypothetical protein
VITVDLQQEDLLSHAMANLRALREIRETLAQGAIATREVETCLALARAAMIKLWQPEACYVKLDARLDDKGIALKNGLTLAEPKLRKSFDEESELFAYGLSLGYDAQAMMQELEGDYALYHFHYLLGRTLLLLMGRQLFAHAKATYPGHHLQRFAIPLVLTEALDGPVPVRPGNRWDPEKIAQLLPFLKASKTDIEVTEAGCLSPLFTMIGLMTKGTKK